MGSRANTRTKGCTRTVVRCVRKHDAHARRPSPARGTKSGASISNDAQLLQKISPQYRQWCFRRSIEN